MPDRPESAAAEAAASEKPAPVIAGFELLKRVGRGGMGAVYRARQISVDRIVAVKILRPELAGNREFIARFQEEARAAARLNHPNIVQAIDAGEANGYFYFAMEFVDGETMHRQMMREGIIEEAKSLRICMDVARALGHAQSHGIVHRDIKPGNIMLTNEGVTKLCDLGLARVENEASEIVRGQAVGTPYYISPEQALGKMDVDCRSDIYSLGATLYRAVTGRPAFNAPTGQEILEQHVRNPLPWPKDHNPALSEGICFLIAKMMAKKPEERYQTPDELAEDIERILSGQAPKSSTIQLAMPPVRLSEAERAEYALTTARLRGKKDAVRHLADVRELIDQVAAKQGIAAHSVVRLLRGNLDEQKAETFLKYGILLLAERKFNLARMEFHRAAELGADVSQFMDKIDALGAPAGMVYIPGGEFLSGPPDQQRTASVPAFYMDINLVTNRRFSDYLKAVPNAGAPGNWIDREPPEGLLDHPVTSVTWEEARAFAEWRGKRLPGALEWEKAARGTDGRRYPWGNEFDRLRCNSQESGVNDTTQAGRYVRGASPYGCLDMLGNVLQWCQEEGPFAPNQPDGRATCGCSYEETAAPMGAWRVEFRKRQRRSRKCGFRCAMAV